MWLLVGIAVWFLTLAATVVITEERREGHFRTKPMVLLLLFSVLVSAGVPCWVAVTGFMVLLGWPAIGALVPGVVLGLVLWIVAGSIFAADAYS